MKSEKEGAELSRREFIKKTSLSAIGVSLLSGVPSIVKGAILNKSISAKSKVVLVQHSKVISATGETDTAILNDMLNSAITSFSGENSAASYFKKIFTHQDIIGLKINTLGISNIAGSPATNHYQAITSSIINSLEPAGISAENIIIWDRSEDELTTAGFTIQKEKGQTRILGNMGKRGGQGGEGYSEKELMVGEKTTRLSKILTEMATAMINIPLMKDHGTAGVTGALKNHYGTINNPRDFHADNATNPGIPEINLLQDIRGKQRLIIMDALMGVFNGGPRWDRRFMWPFGGILIGTDPVAVDTIMYNLINERRISEGLQVISEANAKHIRIAGEIGLGKNNLDEIDLVKIMLG